MNITLYLFYFFAGLSIVSALLILVTKKVLYAAFLLMLSFLGVAAVYIFAQAEYVAMTQIIVYVGAVLVLMVFGIMLTNRISGEPVTTETHNRFWGGLISLGLFVIFIMGIGKFGLWMPQANSSGIYDSTLKSLGILLMTNNILPFEVIGLLLLVALVGAAFILGEKETSSK